MSPIRPVRGVAALLLAAAALVPVAATPATAAAPTAPAAATPTLAFSGRTWTVKAYNRPLGPGPNLFSAANATVDANGHLHLAITKTSGKWSCAEVILNESLGYGTYEWELGTDVSHLDKQVVLGLFTWNDASAYNHREIDIETAKWGNASDPTNSQWVVQPYSTTGNLQRWTIGSTVPTVVRFTWAPTSVRFETVVGGVVTQSWVYGGADVPVPGGENARMNLWLYRGKAPSDGKPVDVTINRFSWLPLP